MMMANGYHRNFYEDDSPMAIEAEVRESGSAHEA